MRKYLLLFIFFILCSCAGNKSNDSGKKAKRFTLPEVPSLIVSKQEQNLFILNHYWDNVDFADTSFIKDPSFGQYFCNFILLMRETPEKDWENAMKILWEKSSRNKSSQESLVLLFERYLGHPNSPYRNNRQYIAFLQSVIASFPINSPLAHKSDYALRLEMKNIEGSVASDLLLLCLEGSSLEQKHLYSLESEYILLYFNNPDCQECKNVTQYLSESMADLFEKSGTVVLSIYPDTDFEKWRISSQPQGWIKAIDIAQQINQQQIYYIKAIPTIYLLDSDKRVLLKDCTVDELHRFYNSLF